MTLPTPHGNSRPSTDCTVLPFQRGSHCRPCPPTGAGAGNPVAYSRGPWRGGLITKGQAIGDEIVAEFVGNRGQTLGAITDASDRFVALIASTDATVDEDRANANLIAAAPDLLEALQRADKLIENLWDAVPWGQTFGLDIAALNEVPMAMKRAISKALGESTHD